MKSHFTALGAVALMTAPILAQDIAPPPMDPPPAGAYRLDTAHSSLIVHVDHMGFSRYPVRFTRFDVEMDLKI